ncbi:glycerophosphodiester phosphodiesterase [Agaribacter marinus]|uniref:Glycerophosphodiester phosphodiesterase n=1 Tax=Virgibacillus salarius TaxID=447199 RepID=A0A941IBE7_9BACI|nr:MULTISPECIES: glycerophosphodiester phosphodiesterase family protein [Bacillaceae]MBR7797658.1 glycerophosphodiester phosphodiesterase [Virgibacillus salarius]NAZ10368.1 glycerophosphodiester phosphodiesterase [Agaribacter marinus]WBX81929.1 glycerophosphodiester phosphodiesterase family protein [Virgibacillus salarius]
MRIRGIGHRGYPAKYPENTKSSFQAAIDLNYTHIELDVHLSKDGIPVVMHDHKIDRMTNGKGEIREYTLKELRNFTINDMEVIPTLEEVLLIAKDRVTVSIELKNPKLYNNMEEIVCSVIEDTNMMDQVYIISFDQQALMRLRNISDKLEIGLLVNKFKRSHFRTIEKLGAKYIAVRYDGIKESYINKCEQKGIQLIVWTVNSMESMEYYNQFPSVLVTTDELEKYCSVSKIKLANDLEEVNA